MDYESKYKNAFERARKIHEYSSDLAEIKRMEHIFPELRESEDEEMVECLNNCLDELEEKNGWRYIYVNSKNVELNKVRNWLKSFKKE